MNRIWKTVIAAILVVAVFATVRLIVLANRPLVEAPWGTAPLDNKLDTADTVHLVVDEAGVLSEKTEQIISIYNANWSVLKNRVMAVVTVENTENAEEDAWKWAHRLTLGTNDALLLIEADSGRKCVLISDGTFREDIATLDGIFLRRLTYTPLQNGEFDTAVLAVFARLHYLCGYDAEGERQTYATIGLIALLLLAAVVFPTLIHMIAEKVDSPRFKRWHSTYGTDDPPIVPWKTAFFWHRAGSKWYNARISGEWVDYRALIHEARRKAGIRHMMRGR